MPEKSGSITVHEPEKTEAGYLPDGESELRVING
jgi:hypothetical protein